MAKFTNEQLSWHPMWDLMIGRKPPAHFQSDGSSNSPDVLFGVDIRPAAHYHDFAYSGRGNGPADEYTRYTADQLFMANLKTCGLNRVFAKIYYYRVRFWGHRHYVYSPGREPKRTLGFYLNLLVGRYVQW